MEQTSIYENTAQKKCDSDTDDEMGIPDDLKIVNRCNRKYDDNFSEGEVTATGLEPRTT